ncbi:MAG: TRAP transporter small permease subunit [Motiliproteus sp.]|nr:TRAP transporter small permease subunit [Motiliproteus sp.]MCW9052258.1 TRAP transporter small permease subunit [Motiliproteus sp.]
MTEVNTHEAMGDTPQEGRESLPNLEVPNAPLDKLVRIFSISVVVITVVFLFNDYLIFWQGWPGMLDLLAHLQWLGEPLKKPLEAGQVSQGWIQLFTYFGGIGLVAAYVLATPKRGLRQDSAYLSAFSAYVIRAAFWMVFLVGLVDMTISLLRVEELLASVIGDEITQNLGRPSYRGEYVHYPLIGLSFLIALFARSLGFTWLAFLVVIAEFQIVIFRFVFSYEQAFMGDLVRFWYAALFLFASAHTLVIEGHVRVDVLYAHFSQRAKAWSNTVGLLTLGLPLCWIILTMGMWGKGSSINSPLLSFEISQSGYGMYVKYLMVAFLVFFAFSMIVQFCSYLLSNIADLRNEPGRDKPAVTFSH